MRSLAVTRLISILVLAACGAACESEAARRAEQLQHERELARIEVEKKQQLLALEAEAERTRIRELAEQQAKAVDSRVREAVANMELSTRRSLMDDTTKVLILRNVQPYSVDMNLKCFTQSGNSKTLFVSVPPRASKEVGFLEGWDGNFVSGERCEMLHEQVTLREFSIP